MIFDKFVKKQRLFRDYSKSICHGAKGSIWLQSACHSANVEYNIIKIREKKFSHILQYWPVDFDAPCNDLPVKFFSKFLLLLIFDPGGTPIRAPLAVSKKNLKMGHPKSPLINE